MTNNSTQQRHHLENLQKIHERRLQLLEVQATTLGLFTPTHVLMEIEEIRSKIQDLENQLKYLPSIVNKTGSAQVNILFMSADPTNASRLRLGEEFREIQEKLQLAQYRDRFSMQQRTSTRPQDLSQAFLDIKPTIVHFSGHGNRFGELCFESNAGEILPIDADDLGDLFSKFSSTIKCVVLNACYSEAQASSISNSIDCVIGVNQEISDKASIAFSIGFYQALGAGLTCEQAYDLGCVQIGLQGIPEKSTFVIKLKK